MQQVNKLDKALHWLAELELDKAFELLFELLAQEPKDRSLIERIYKLSHNLPQTQYFDKLCHHLFSVAGYSSDFHSQVIKAYAHLLDQNRTVWDYNISQTYNLFYHLSQSYLSDSARPFENKIKTELADNPETAVVLKHYCEHLIASKQLIKAKEELSYLSNYYAETDSGRWALQRVKQVESAIIV